MRSQEKLFTASVLIEVAAGLPTAGIPALAIWLLLGVREPSPEALVASRIGGAGLLAIAVACWLGRDDGGSSSQHGLLWALLLYNVGAFAVLAFLDRCYEWPVSRFGLQSGFTLSWRSGVR